MARASGAGSNTRRHRRGASPRAPVRVARRGTRQPPPSWLGPATRAAIGLPPDVRHRWCARRGGHSSRGTGSESGLLAHSAPHSAPHVAAIQHAAPHRPHGAAAPISGAPLRAARYRSTSLKIVARNAVGRCDREQGRCSRNGAPAPTIGSVHTRTARTRARLNGTNTTTRGQHENGCARQHEGRQRQDYRRGPYRGCGGAAGPQRRVARHRSPAVRGQVGRPAGRGLAGRAHSPAVAARRGAPALRRCWHRPCHHRHATAGGQRQRSAGRGQGRRPCAATLPTVRAGRGSGRRHRGAGPGRHRGSRGRGAQRLRATRPGCRSGSGGTRRR